MNDTPVVIESSTDLTEASKTVTERLKFPVTEDFIITQDGKYLGMGAVMHLLRAMDERLTRQATELSAALEQLKASQIRLVQSEKMASLGQMVAGVAHEINTPLGYVKNNMEMMEMFFESAHVLLKDCDSLVDSLLSPLVTEEELQAKLRGLGALKEGLAGSQADDLAKLFADTHFGIDRISEIVLNLKNFSRLDRAMADDVDINECLDSALLLARNVLKNKVEVVRQYGQLPRISCMPSQLNQVFLNLLTNAAQAIEERGRILVKSEADGEWLRITVQDTGKGIPAEVLPKIFDPFFTTKPVGQGTGLGLSISYDIIKQHGGDIRVTSQPGKGSRFTIQLPLIGDAGGQVIPLEKAS
jgi:two-component system NtrC family sensor kinase